MNKHHPSKYYSGTVGKSRGFSFGETLLAAFILSVGLVVVVRIFQVSITNSLFLREATIASALAQEGVELVRNVRDNNYIAGGTGFAAFSANNHCYLAVNSTNLNCYSSQGGTSQYNLTYSGGQYIATASASTFRRYIHVTYTGGASPQAVVKSFVVWGSASIAPYSTGTTTDCTIKNQCVYTEALLTNWKS